MDNFNSFDDYNNDLKKSLGGGYQTEPEPSGNKTSTAEIPVNKVEKTSADSSKKQKKDKGKSPVKRFFGIVFAALIFGFFAALSFRAFNEAMDYLKIGNGATALVSSKKKITIIPGDDKSSHDGFDSDIEVDTDIDSDIEADTGISDSPEIDTDLSDDISLGDSGVNGIDSASDIVRNGFGMEHQYTTTVTDVTGVVDKVMPSIVSITNSYTYSYYYYEMPVDAKGSGIIVGKNDNELLIVTNYHVIADNESLSVTFNDNSQAPAIVKGTDSSMDLAVIAVSFEDISSDTMDAISYAVIGNSDLLKVGEPAIAIGNALGYGQSVTTGVVSAVNREMDMNNDGNVAKFIQTDAAINEGNSGGALLNLSGELIGINSNKIGGSKVEGMGYAIPISAAEPIIEELMVKETRKILDEDEMGCLGISGATVTAQEALFYNYPEGIYIAGVYRNSGAEEAGLSKGDFIVSFEGEAINSMEQLQRLLKYYKVGEKVELGVYKATSSGYKLTTVTVELSGIDVIDG